MNWEDLLSTETEYWEETVSNRNGRFFTIADWLDPNTELQDEYKHYVTENSSIIDVGAAVCTKLGKNLNGNKLKIVAVDILAEEYSKILIKNNIAPPVVTLKGSFETIVETFGENSFDFVFSSNAIDHCIDPVNAISQLYSLTKPGGYVYISLHKNEALRSNWQGLHQWNFYDDGNNVLISNKLDDKVQVSYNIQDLSVIGTDFQIINFVIKKV